jgi:hypothetical protein
MIRVVFVYVIRVVLPLTTSPAVRIPNASPAKFKLCSRFTFSSPPQHQQHHVSIFPYHTLSNCFCHHGISFCWPEPRCGACEVRMTNFGRRNVFPRLTTFSVSNFFSFFPGFRHTVFFRFKNNVTIEDQLEVQKRFVSLKDLCKSPITGKPYIVSLDTGFANSPEVRTFQTLSDPFVRL